MSKPNKPTGAPVAGENIESEVGKRGFQDGLFEKFTKLSQSGKELLDKLIEFAEEQEKEKKDIAFQIMELQKQAIQTLLQILKGEEAGQKNKQQADTEAAAIISQQLSKNNTPSPQPTTDPKAAEKKGLESSLKDMQKELSQKKEQYKTYDKNLDKADKFINNLPKDREARIKKLEKELERIEGTEKQRNKEAEKAMMLTASDDPKDVAKGRKMLEDLNARAVQAGPLRDALAVTKGDKVLYDKDGKVTDSFKDGEYAVPKDKKLVKEGDNFYLLGKDQELTDDNRAQAKQSFERNKREMSSVRDLVENNKSIELGDMGKKIDSMNDRIQKLQQPQEPRKTKSQDQDAEATQDKASAPSKGSDSFDFSSLPDTANLGDFMQIAVKAIEAVAKVISDFAKALEQANAASQKATQQPEPEADEEESTSSYSMKMPTPPK